MNGNTYFNLRFYNPLPVHFGSHSASEPHIFRGLLGDFPPPPPPYFVPGYKKYHFIQNRGHSEVSKKTPSSAKYVRRVRPPLYLRAPQYPPRAACIANYVVNDAWRACITFAIWRQFLRKMNAARRSQHTHITIVELVYRLHDKTRIFLFFVRNLGSLKHIHSSYVVGHRAGPGNEHNKAQCLPTSFTRLRLTSLPF